MSEAKTAEFYRRRAGQIAIPKDAFIDGARQPAVSGKVQVAQGEEGQVPDEARVAGRVRHRRADDLPIARDEDDDPLRALPVRG